MRWTGQRIDGGDPDALPGLDRPAGLAGLVRTVETPEFAGVRFHEVLARTALNRVPGTSPMPFRWTVNPYRGCTHGCVYCFARGTHRYLDLDTGEGFDREIVVKANVVEVLRRELARPSWAREHVALGTNTDPYQRAEGRYALMPGIIDALAASGTPFSILTKGTLVRRDLDRIAAAARVVPVQLSVSVAVHDDALAASLEPGTPSVRARLETVRAAAALGLGVTVFLVPVLPFLTDSRAHLQRAAEAVAAAGASNAAVGALHLRPGAREWFFAWLARERPDLVARYRELYAGGATAPVGYRRWLSATAAPILRAAGLGVGPAAAESLGGAIRPTRRRTAAGTGPEGGGAVSAPVATAAVPLWSWT